MKNTTLSKLYQYKLTLLAAITVFAMAGPQTAHAILQKWAISPQILAYSPCENFIPGNGQASYECKNGQTATCTKKSDKRDYDLECGTCDDGTRRWKYLNFPVVC